MPGVTPSGCRCEVLSGLETQGLDLQNCFFTLGCLRLVLRISNIELLPAEDVTVMLRCGQTLIAVCTVEVLGLRYV